MEKDITTDSINSVVEDHKHMTTATWAVMKFCLCTCRQIKELKFRARLGINLN